MPRLDRLRADRRAAPDPGDRAGFRRRRDHPRGAGQRPQRALRPRPGQEDRRHGLPRRDRLRGVRRARPRLPDLRADRRGGRARRFVGPHGRLRPDLARLQLDRALGHRGAEARVAAAPVLGRDPGLLRPDRAEHGLRRRQSLHPREEDRRRLVDLRPEAVDLDGQLREARAGLRPDRSREEAQGPGGVPRADGDARASRPARSTASSGCGRPTRRSCRSTRSRCRTRRCSAGWATASRWP